MMLLLMLQNVITYTINVADNIMLGAYSQTSLSAAAAVNQIQYILQQFILCGLGEGLVIVAGQHWGRGDVKAVGKIASVALALGLLTGILLTTVAIITPSGMMRIFTNDEEIVAEGAAYLSIIRFTYIPFILTNLLLQTLRSVQVLGIAFRVSCCALVINAGINYTLIFGRFGFPEMGIRGAAIGTLIAICTELVIVIVYIRKSRAVPEGLRKTNFFEIEWWRAPGYLKVSAPVMASAIIFASAVSVQTMVYGHISGDALAAGSAAGTFFQYCKMIPISTASASAVLIAKTVGSGHMERLKQMVHSLQVVFIGIGIISGTILFFIRGPILSLYSMTDTARSYAKMMMGIQSAALAFCAYQMPCQVGIIRGGGETRYSMISDFIYSWIVVVPLSLLAAFVLKWPLWAVVICLNIDQMLKCITVPIKLFSYTWVKKLT